MVETTVSGRNRKMTLNIILRILFVLNLMYGLWGDNKNIQKLSIFATVILGMTLLMTKE